MPKVASTEVPPWRRKQPKIDDDHHQDAKADGDDADCEWPQQGMAKPVEPEWPDAWSSFKPPKSKVRWDPYMVASSSSASSSGTTGVKRDGDRHDAQRVPQPPPPHPKSYMKNEV